MTAHKPPTPPSQQEMEDLPAGDLPPLQQAEANPLDADQAGGISPPLKRTILLFTVFTFLAFVAFGAMFVKSMLGSQAKEAVWDEEILTLAERLHDAGLHDQALRQYERYLDNPKLDFETRGRVAYTTASLYLELDNCAEGLVWLYHSHTAYPAAPWASELNGKIDVCLTRLNHNPQ